jgi:hypothetical protein
MKTVIKTFEQLEPGDTIIIPGDPKCSWLQFREDHEHIVEKKYDGQTVKLEELGGVVVQMPEYKVKLKEA